VGAKSETNNSTREESLLTKSREPLEENMSHTDVVMPVKKKKKKKKKEREDKKKKNKTTTNNV
jgi:hypothetical protein